MGRIQASTGLVTGIDIQGTVDKLIALQGQPRDRLVESQKSIQAKQAAVVDLTALTIALQSTIKKLGKSSLFDGRAVTSSASNLISASIGSGKSPPVGVFNVTPIRLATSQQLASSSIADSSTAVGAGTIEIGQGSSLAQDIALSKLNGGNGVASGKIRITDRSGTSSIVDLRNARDISDVINAINNDEEISVRAEAVGDRIRLTDVSGQTTNNLKVTEVAGGTTAADLGLGSINAAANSAVGEDILRLSSSLKLSDLNDGAGLSLRNGSSDLSFELRDGSRVQVDFRRTARPASNATATVEATSGFDGDVRFRAVSSGADYDGVKIKFVSSGSVAKGAETASYDAGSKTLTFDIAAGQTTAADIVATVNRTPTVKAIFTADLPTGSSGAGIVSTSDSATTQGGAAVSATNEQTLGDLLATINSAAPTRLKASISSSGDSLVFEDLTSGSGAFKAADFDGGSLAKDLGLGATAGGRIESSRLLGGLDSPLLRSLNGGRGLGDLGTISVTDRAGHSATIDVSSAQTLDDVIESFNGSGLSIRASLNASKNGIQIRDTSGALTSNLIVANGDTKDSATKLGIAKNVAEDSISGSSLRKQSVSEDTLLSSLRNGAGIQNGSFLITDTEGHSSAVNLTQIKAKTVGDVIDAINGLSIGVTARINDNGDGIAIVDRAHGTGNLEVRDSGNGSAAKSLRLTTSSQSQNIGGRQTQVIDGSLTDRVTVTSTDSLEDVAKKINDLNGAVSATVTQNADGNGYRLVLGASRSGAAGSVVVSSSVAAIQFDETTSGRDALIRIGSGQGENSLVTSTTNEFQGLLGGVDLTIKGTSSDPATITVSEDQNAIASAIQAFVDQFNKLKDKIDKYTSYDTSSNAKGVLFGSSETLRLESSFSRALSGSFGKVGAFRSLESIGVSVSDKGKLSFNRDDFDSAYSRDKNSVESLFTDATSGFSAKLDEIADDASKADNSLLVNRAAALQKQYDVLSARVTAFNERLDRSRDRLLRTYYNLEITVQKIQSNFSGVTNALNTAVTLSNSFATSRK